LEILLIQQNLIFISLIKMNVIGRSM